MNVPSDEVKKDSLSRSCTLSCREFQICSFNFVCIFFKIVFALRFGEQPVLLLLGTFSKVFFLIFILPHRGVMLYLSRLLHHYLPLFQYFCYL